MEALGRVATPEGSRDYRPAVYGSLLVTTLIAVQWRYDAAVEFVAFSLLVSVAIFWLAHAWSELVNRRVRGPIDRREAAAVARAESPMLVTAVLPAMTLGLARLEITTVDGAIAIALLVSIVQLFVWGLAVGRAVGRGWLVAVAVAAVDCALGVAIVVLKAIVLH